MLAHSTTSNLNYIQHMQHHSRAWYSNTTSVLHWVKRQRCLCVASSFCSYKLTFCSITNTWKHMQVTNSRKYAVPDNVNWWSPWNITCLDLGNDYVTTKVRTNPGRNKQLLGLPWRASIHDKFAAPKQTQTCEHTHTQTHKTRNHTPTKSQPHKPTIA